MMTEDEYFEKAVVRQVKPLVRHFGLCWSLCKVRKETVCYLSGRRIMAGTLAYRPITNGKMRMHRIKPNTGDKARREGGKDNV
jgi:hypothetical protein